MQLIKLLLFTLVVCLCSFLSAQSPSHLTQYTWNADTDSWQEAVREIHTEVAPSQKVVLTQYKENQSWLDWTRTTTHFNELDLATYTLTERWGGGQFIPVVKKEFSFDETGRLLSQIDQSWNVSAQVWQNIYKEIRHYSPPFGEQVSMLSERIIYKPDPSKTGWVADEQYDFFRFVVDNGTQEFSRRSVFEGGAPIVKDQLVTRTNPEGKEVTFMTGRVGDWTPVTKVLMANDLYTASKEFFTYNSASKSWEKSQSEETYFNELGKVRTIKGDGVVTSFSYDAKGRVKEILRKKALGPEYAHQMHACGGQMHLPDEVKDANISREVYAYPDEMELSYEQAYFDMVLYPNPMKQDVAIRLSEWIAGSCEVKVMDLKGRTIMQKSFSSTSSLSMEREGISPGSYVLQLISTQGVKTARLMIID